MGEINHLVLILKVYLTYLFGCKDTKIFQKNDRLAIIQFIIWSKFKNYYILDTKKGIVFTTIPSYYYIFTTITFLLSSHS